MQKEQSVLSKEFPNKLRQLRGQRGWSQEQLGKKIGIERNRISRYERGTLWPSLELLVRLANVFEVSLDYLIREAEEMAINKVGNPELLKRMEEADRLSQEKQTILIGVLDAFIKQQKFEELVQS